MNPVRFGIVGCGGIARKAFLPAIRASSVARLVAVTDVDTERAAAVAREGDVTVEPNLDALVRRGDVDALYVATVNSAHVGCIETAVRNGIHVLCEKPLVETAAEARRLVALCAERQVAVLEGFAYQHHTQHACLRERVKRGDIGKPILLQAWFGFPPLPPDNYRYSASSGGGALLDAGSYTVHVARSFFGREPIRVSAVLDREGRDVDIHGTVLLDFGDAQTASLAFGFNNFYRSQYSVWGTRGLLTLPRAFAIPPTLAPTLRLERQDFFEEQVLQPCDPFASELAVFCSGLSDPETRARWRQDALGQAEAMDAVRMATDLGQAIGNHHEG
jgi:predicted dehydrogenase